MDFKVNVYFDYDISTIFADDNLVGNVLKTRVAVSQNPDYEFKGTYINGFYTRQTFVWMRTAGVTEPKSEIKDGVIYHFTPLLDEEENRGKEGSRFILHPGNLCAGYYFAHPAIEESAKYLMGEVDESSDEYKRAVLIKENVTYAPTTALKRLLKKKIPNKKIEYIGNDIEVNGKKIMGISHMQNTSGVHIVFGINYKYDHEYFEGILTEDEFHRKTGQGITGITDEIPGYSKNDFTKDFMDELQVVLLEAERFF